jgi:hypothetical protein
MIRRAFKRLAARIPPEGLERALAHARLSRLQDQFSRAQRCERRDAVWDRAIAEVGAGEPVRLLEFGVFRGESIRYFAERFSHPEARFVGFDSFEGLPEAWVGYEAGTFSTGGRVPEIADARVSFCKGWFQDSVPAFLGANGTNWSDGRPVLVHFDADLFSSTLFLLTTLWHRISRYHFVFDEFMGHELRAWSAFREAYPVSAEILAYDLQDNYPCRVLGRLERVAAQA